jgi:ubiquinone/menaquinone biosynthesis C-methylase UbiE
MNLRSGIPTQTDVDGLIGSELYRQHSESNASFLNRHGDAMASYRRRWEFDPFKLWSRRWEYPYVARHALAYADQLGRSTPMKMLDAGSGVTYLPHHLCKQVPGLHVVACDYDTSYVPMFDSICNAEGHGRVSFAQADMRQLPMPDASFDLVLCVSVLEHTDQYSKILSEFRRVLKPGGLMTLTFDISLDDKFTLTRAQATELLSQIARDFKVVEDLDVIGELKHLDQTGPLLTTDAVRTTNPDLLPWRHPMLKAMFDLMKGRGWTGGFCSKTVFCVSARKPF